jgi:hypothetical protein
VPIWQQEKLINKVLFQRFSECGTAVDRLEMLKINNINGLNEEYDMDDLFLSHLKTTFQLKKLYKSSVECEGKLSGMVSCKKKTVSQFQIHQNSLAGSEEHYKALRMASPPNISREPFRYSNRLDLTLAFENHIIARIFKLQKKQS